MNIYDQHKARLEREWPIGSKVRYIGRARMFQGCEGCIEEHYPGFDDDLQPDPYLDSVAVKCYSKSELWPYIGTDSFAPDVDEIERIK